MVEVQEKVSSASLGQKKAKKSVKKVKSTHPSTSVMVIKAIQVLKERNGSSFKAIKKYIGSSYSVDAEKLSPFIKKYLKTAVASGALVQTKGKGVGGSFKVGGTSVKKSISSGVTKQKKQSVKKPKIESKSPKSKKPTKRTKSVSEKASTKVKKIVAEKKSKTIKKPKAPKPKKAIAKPKMKKPAPKKK